MKRHRGWLLLLSLPVLVAAGAVLVRFGGAADPCPTARTPVVVTARGRTLWLCEGGHAAARFPVSLGSRGVGKHVEGDRRTPIGTYTLGSPHPSQGYGTFVPLGYPTAAERRSGLTGGAVGIHGPKRRLRWMGAANAWSDWTAGCVALPSDEAVERVAAIARRGGATVDIR